MTWDDKPITLDQLEQLLMFDADPDKPNKKLDLRKHHKQQPTLFPQEITTCTA